MSSLSSAANNYAVAVKAVEYAVTELDKLKAACIAKAEIVGNRRKDLDYRLEELKEAMNENTNRSI